MEVLKLEDGKYTIQREPGRTLALRYDEAWQDLTGNKMVNALVDEVFRLQMLVAAFEAARCNRDIAITVVKAP